MAEQITDADVRSARSGEAVGFRRIYRVMSPVVLGYLTASGVTDPEALTSDVFLSLLPRLGELHGGAAGLRTFIMSVAHARMVDDVRRRARQPATVEYHPGTDTRTSQSAESEALSAVSTRRLVELLARLPTDQREVVALRFVADMPLDEVATVMQRSVGAVKQLQRRGLIALRDLVESTEVTPR